jgi:intein/homing endonuclease
MTLQALADYTFISRYARYNKDLKRRETYHEAIDRVKNMHLEKYPMAKAEINFAFDYVHQKLVLGSQRALQFGGRPILTKNARIFNCSAGYCDRVRFFQEATWLLLCGVGVGVSVTKNHITKLPEFHKNLEKPSDFDGSKTFVIEDSIEGWADAFGVLLASYMPHDEFSAYYGRYVEFDFHKIRPKGAGLSYGVGKAPGPDPLKASLERCRKVLDTCLNNNQRRLRPIDAMDILLHASDCVISGGIRRSAVIVLFSKDDMEMMTAKTGDWYYTNPQRARSNNSVLLDRNTTTSEEYGKLFASAKQFGEPGIVWTDCENEQLFNPCVTEDTIVVTKNGIVQVKNIIGQKFDALVDGKIYSSTEKGFWKTGNKDVIKLTFESGRELKLTSNHKIMTSEGWKEAGEISFKDEIIIHDHSQNESINVDKFSKSYAQGYLLGSFIGDGNIVNVKGNAQVKWWGENKHHYRKDAYDLLEQAEWKNCHHQKNTITDLKNPYCAVDSKKLYDFAKEKDCIVDGKKYLSMTAIQGNWSYLAGIVSGYFDADGTVLFNKEKGSSVRLSSTFIDNLKYIQLILGSFGIASKIYQNRRPKGFCLLPDGHGGKKLYPVAEAHELIVSRNSIEKFAQHIGFRNIDKNKKLNKIIATRIKVPYRSKFVDKIVNKEFIGKHDVYDCTIESIHAFDANGIYVHNCNEISLRGYDRYGNSGFQFCNLSEINGSKLIDKDQFVIAAKAASIIGTLQAGYTEFSYLGKVSEDITNREALLGVSITGMMDNPDICFNPSIQREMAHLVIETNKSLANKIGINQAARSTTVKPAGSTSCILETSSGIHPHHAHRYFRRVQANNIEAPVQLYKQYNPDAVELSVWSANKTDDVITFMCEVPQNALIKSNVDAIKLLEYVKLTQENWIESGKVKELCAAPWLCHNVSNTINVGYDEWDAVEKFIYKNRESFAGISLLGNTGDLDYNQAPFTKVLDSDEIIQKYGRGSLFASGLIVDALHAFDDNLWQACDALLGFYEVKAPTPPEKLCDKTFYQLQEDYRKYTLRVDWIRRAKQFAERYVENNIKELTYMLKDVNNTKLWHDLKRSHVPVNYENLIEEEDNTKLAETIACSGPNGCDPFMRT